MTASASLLAVCWNLIAIATTAGKLYLYARHDSQYWDLAAMFGTGAGGAVMAAAAIERVGWAGTGSTAFWAGFHLVVLLSVSLLTVWVLEDTIVERPAEVPVFEKRYPDWLISGLKS